MIGRTVASLTGSPGPAARRPPDRCRRSTLIPMARRPGRTLAAVLAVLVLSTAGGSVGLAVLAPGRAIADGDPASDTLLIANVFYPYVPPTSPALQRLLNGATAAAARERTPVRVALIASPTDLGLISVLFGKPQEYADFLDREISFTTEQPLLVVMHDGYGTQGLSAAARAAVLALPMPAGDTSDDLAVAALTAVRRIAAANGHPLAVLTTSSGSGGGGGASFAILGVLVAAALASTAVVVTVTLRRRLG